MTMIHWKGALAAVVLGLAVGGGTSALGLAQIASSAAGEAMPHSDQVSIDNFTFAPAVLTVKVGTSVTWLNRDDIPHTILSKDRRIKSPVLDTDDKFAFTFDAPGTYEYFCSIHPHMTGKVVVVP